MEAKKAVAITPYLLFPIQEEEGNTSESLRKIKNAAKVKQGPEGWLTLEPAPGTKRALVDGIEGVTKKGLIRLLYV